MTTQDETKTGGPAFPAGIAASPMGDIAWSNEGMTLRDWFAGQVIAQIIAMYAADNKTGIGVDHLPRNCAGHAYRIADAMLAERSK